MSTSVRISALLAEPARHYVNPNGTAGVIVVLGAPGADSVQVEAHRYYGQGPAAQIAAHNAAHHMRSGSRVTVHASGWRLRGHRLVLTDVSHIEHHRPFLPPRARFSNEELFHD